MLMTRYASRSQIDVLRSVKVIKDKERLRNCHKLKETKENDSLMQCVILDWMLDQQKDIDGTIGEI